MSDALPPATTSPIALERRNSLEKAILNRPEAHELREKHILLNTNAAPYEVTLTDKTSRTFTNEPQSSARSTTRVTTSQAHG
jgi:hypothetical protein